VTARVTVIIVVVYMGVTSIVTLVYDNWHLEKVKTPQDEELAQLTTP
jgi:hypothetical protein